MFKTLFGSLNVFSGNPWWTGCLWNK